MSVALSFSYQVISVLAMTMDLYSHVLPEKPETGESVADAQAPYPVENAGHNYAVDNGSPQGLKLTAGMADKPVQRASLREKLEAFKAKAAGTEKQENRKEKGKEVTMQA